MPSVARVKSCGVLGQNRQEFRVRQPPSPSERSRALQAQAASLRNPSQSVRNPTTWFQLGVIRDAGPEIRNGLGAYLYAVWSKTGFGRGFWLRGAAKTAWGPQKAGTR